MGWRAVTLATAVSRANRLSSGRDWMEAQAPSLLVRDRLAKIVSDDDLRKYIL